MEGTFLLRLCTECAALSTSVFPLFINEAICGDLDHHCYGHRGQCVQRVLRFTFLRRTEEFVRDDAWNGCQRRGIGRFRAIYQVVL